MLMNLIAWRIYLTKKIKSKMWDAAIKRPCIVKINILTGVIFWLDGVRRINLFTFIKVSILQWDSYINSSNINFRNYDCVICF